MNWQPIETAPKDGTPVLGTWKDTWPSPHIETVACEPDGEYWFYHYDGDKPNLPPTHWMPLPEPPK